MEDISRALFLFSRILEYPQAILTDDIEECLQKIKDYDRVSTQSLKKFSAKVSKIPLLELQELYTQHIDFNPSCSLYVGYHLYGDSYKRSKFLVELRTLYQEAHFIEKGSELPDSLPIILHYFAEHSYYSDNALLIIKESLLPCLKKLQGSFKKAKNIYHELIHSVWNLLFKIEQEHSALATAGGSING